MYVSGKRRQTTKGEFHERFRVMTGGMFENIDLSTYDSCVTGSSLVPCVSINPLEANYSSFEVFAESRYPSYSAIGNIRIVFDRIREIIMVRLAKLRDAQPLLNSVICKMDNVLDDDEFVYQAVAANKHISDPLLTSYVNDICKVYEDYCAKETLLSDIDVAVTSVSFEDYDNKVHEIFKQIQANIQNKHKKLAEDAGVPFDPSVCHVYLYKQTVKYGFKYVLKGAGTSRCVDFFRISIPMYKLLVGFHLNVVRFWWDGVELRCLASAACAVMTGVNQWYRWFSNNKDPMDIVLKNVQRGYTTLLNPPEIAVLNAYVQEVDKYEFIRECFTVGKVSIKNKLFTSIGGIRDKLPSDNLNFPEENGVIYWGEYNFNMPRLNCDIRTNASGKMLPPKLFALGAMIRDTVA
jgi:hypothetical protein